jgi:hypothetical protein
MVSPALLFAVCSTVAALASAARVADPLFLFEFETHQCAAAAFTDSSTQAVYGGMTITAAAA